MLRLMNIVISMKQADRHFLSLLMIRPSFPAVDAIWNGRHRILEQRGTRRDPWSQLPHLRVGKL